MYICAETSKPTCTYPHVDASKTRAVQRASRMAIEGGRNSPIDFEHRDCDTHEEMNGVFPFRAQGLARHHVISHWHIEVALTAHLQIIAFQSQCA